MHLSKSLSNLSSSNILSLSQSEPSEHLSHQLSTKKQVNDCYRKFISKLGILFQINPSDLDLLYKKIQQCVCQNDNITLASDTEISQMIQIAQQLKQNNHLLKNMIEVLNHKYLAKKDQSMLKQETPIDSLHIEGQEISNRQENIQHQNQQSSMHESRNSYFKERIKHILKSVKDIKGKLSDQSVNHQPVQENKSVNLSQKSIGYEERIEKIQRRNKELQECAKKLSKYMLSYQKQKEQKVLTNEIYTSNEQEKPLEQTQENTNIGIINRLSEEELHDNKFMLNNCRKVISKVDFGEEEKNEYEQIDRIKQRVKSMLPNIQHSENQNQIPNQNGIPPNNRFTTSIPNSIGCSEFHPKQKNIVNFMSPKVHFIPLQHNDKQRISYQKNKIIPLVHAQPIRNKVRFCNLSNQKVNSSIDNGRRMNSIQKNPSIKINPIPNQYLASSRTRPPVNFYLNGQRSTQKSRLSRSRSMQRKGIQVASKIFSK